jgi:hypothetical protein
MNPKTRKHRITTAVIRQRLPDGQVIQKSLPVQSLNTDTKITTFHFSGDTLMNKRQHKKHLKKQSKKPTTPKVTLDLLMAKSKEELLSLAKTRGVAVFKSWNKTRLSNAILGAE